MHEALAVGRAEVPEANSAIERTREKSIIDRRHHQTYNPVEWEEEREGVEWEEEREGVELEEEREGKEGGWRGRVWSGRKRGRERREDGEEGEKRAG